LYYFYLTKIDSVLQKNFFYVDKNIKASHYFLKTSEHNEKNISHAIKLKNTNYV